MFLWESMELKKVYGRGVHPMGNEAEIFIITILVKGEVAILGGKCFDFRGEVNV